MIAAGRVVPWLALLTATDAFAQLPKKGAEFQVNTHFTANQEQAALAVHANGDFVVVWESLGQDGNQDGVFAQRFSSSGATLGGEFQVNAYTTGSSPTLGIQDQPRVAPDGSGGFVVVWRSFSQDGNSYGVVARRFDSAGLAAGDEFVINAYTTGLQRQPAIAAEEDGDFVVTWQSSPQDGTGFGIFARRFDSQGAPRGVEFQVNTYTDSAQYAPAIAIGEEGAFVIVWDSTFQDGTSAPSVFAQRYDSAGGALGPEFQVNTYTPGIQENAAIAMSLDGRFVIVWEGSGDFSSNGVFGQRFDSAGVAEGLQFQVNTMTLQNQSSADIASYPDGDFVVTWNSLAQEGIGSGFGVFAQRFTSGGARIGREFQINTYTPGSQGDPAIAMDAGGSLIVVAWESAAQDGDDNGVFLQRFTGKVAVLDVDADGHFVALFDAVLVIRHAFGFSGASLTDGAVSPTCTRCGASEIADYLDSIADQIDVDDDNLFRPLTDGMLLLRFGMDFTDDALTSGAVGDDCTRCGADEIIQYLDGRI